MKYKQKKRKDEMIEFNKENFKKTVDTNKIVVVDFWAPWCGPCKIMTPIMEELERDFSQINDIVIGKVNVDEETELATAFKIRNIPTVVFIKNGEIKDVMVGVHPRHMYAEKIEALLK